MDCVEHTGICSRKHCVMFAMLYGIRMFILCRMLTVCDRWLCGWENIKLIFYYATWSECLYRIWLRLELLLDFYMHCIYMFRTPYVAININDVRHSRFKSVILRLNYLSIIFILFLWRNVINAIITHLRFAHTYYLSLWPIAIRWWMLKSRIVSAGTKIQIVDSQYILKTRLDCNKYKQYPHDVHAE